MSFSGKKGITVASGFKLQAAALLDARGQAETIADRDELVTLHAVTEGLQVYVKETKTSYVWNGSAWNELSTGAGYEHPTTAGYRHVPAGGASGQILKWKSDGEAQWGSEKSYGNATASSAGLMSPEDKKTLDGVDGLLADKVPVSRKVNGKDLSSDIRISADDVGALAASKKGAAGGVAELDSAGKVPSSQLPSYVDDVLEGYLSGGKFYEDSSHTTEISGESGKIYIDLGSNKTYRWSGSAYAEISASLALGETSSTAYRGDRGKAAYDHSQAAHASSDAQKNVQADWSVTDSGSDAYIKNKPASLPANGGNADTVGGHTVGTNVPAGAVFTDTKPVAMKGAAADTAGSAGYVPVPAAGDQGKVLHGDGTWKAQKTYGKATASADGLMAKEDKKKLDNLPQTYFADELPESAPAGSVCFLI